MSIERVIALEIALKAVFNTAREQGVDVERLSEGAIDSLVKYHPYGSERLGNAASEIETSLDDLEYPWPAAG